MLEEIKKGVFIIAGANQGLGAQLASVALQHNYPVALIARQEQELSKLVKKLTPIAGDKLITVHPLDLTDFQKSTKVFTEIAKQHKKIEVLVNCAATWTGNRSIDNIDYEYMKNSLDLNFFAVFNPIKSLLALPHIHRGLPLTIINMGATASLRGGINMSAFAVAKSAVRILSQSLARELGPQGVHVAHLIIDGLIKNKRTLDLNKGKSEDEFIKMVPLANTIMHIISQDKSCWTFEWDIRPYNERW